MITKIPTIATIGLQGRKIDVEVDIAAGLFSISIVGLAAKAVQESKERVVAALRNSGFQLPHKRITINLAPADLLKSGPIYDLPIATALLYLAGYIDSVEEGAFFWGELSLDGSTRKTSGALVAADSIRAYGSCKLFVPEINAKEAGMIPGINIFPLKNLKELVEHHAGIRIKPVREKVIKAQEGSKYGVNFAELRGQYQAKRALEIAAAGGHNLMMVGTPGSGKTFLARALTGILPELSLAESMEVTKIYSVAGKLEEDSVITQAPFRNPHHTSSIVALTGGGSIPRPGEITLAHRGVLFLDEFSEFSNKSLEALRQPLEDRVVQIARAANAVTFPADFMLIAAMNPCKCGYLGDSVKTCTCTQVELAKYTHKVSGPILDRIDIHIHVPRVKTEDLMSQQASESSEQIRKRVELARHKQLLRYHNQTNFTNAAMTSTDLKRHANISKSQRLLMKEAINKLGLTARGYFRCIKLARTIADLAQTKEIEDQHIAEALTYRELTSNLSQ